MDDHADIYEYRIDWWVGILIALWLAINRFIFVVIQFFVYQQKVIYTPRNTSGMYLITPYLLLLIVGIVILRIIVRRSMPIPIEAMLICFMIALSVVSMEWRTAHIEACIRNEELKALCYQTVKTIVNYSQLLFVFIWIGARFLKQTPIDLKPTIPYYSVALLIQLVGSFSSVVFSFLNSTGILPQIY